MRHVLICRMLLTAVVLLAPAHALAADPTHVPSANPKSPGVVAPNVLSPELAEVIQAQGAMLLENPVSPAKYYGYNDDKPNLVPLPPAFNVEAHKTEPDKNTYLRLNGQRGADPSYDYGHDFLFQGHESGVGGQGYITRINLDADGVHRVTLMATKDVTGKSLPVFDGSAWYPWAQRLLFTFEGGNAGGVWQATLDVPSKVEDISGALGRGGYEGIQADSDGNPGSSRTSAARRAPSTATHGGRTASCTASSRTTPRTCSAEAASYRCWPCFRYSLRARSSCSIAPPPTRTFCRPTSWTCIPTARCSKRSG